MQNNSPKKTSANKLDNWRGERWVNTNSPAVRKIMIARLDYAKTPRGFYGVDVDNVDIYEFKTGFSNTRRDAANYVRFPQPRSPQARAQIRPEERHQTSFRWCADSIDYYVNEQCHQYKRSERLPRHPQARLQHRSTAPSNAAPAASIPSTSVVRSWMDVK